MQVAEITLLPPRETAQQQSQPAIQPVFDPMVNGSASGSIDTAGYKEALALWYRVVLNSVHSNSFDLSNRQMALLLTLNSEIGPHTVRSLASHLKISKPAVCRALDTLSKFELAARIVDQSDRRNVFIFLTDNGRNFLKKFSGTIMNCLSEIE